MMLRTSERMPGAVTGSSLIFCTVLTKHRNSYIDDLNLGYCRRHNVRNLTRTLVHVTVLNAIGELNFLQLENLRRMDHQLILDFYQCHLQSRAAALVVLLLQLLNGPV